MRTSLLAFVIALAACGGDDGDDDPAVDAFVSACGQPGDLGNELGVGKFCATLGDCGDTTDAPLCSSLGDPSTHFCTKTCTAPTPGSPNECGTDAECTCSGGNCGCVVSACLE